MSEEVFEAIARPSSGFVESPAGCGKTEAIVRAVGLVESGRQLVLTHTNAGVDVLRQRFRKQNILRTKFHVDTIAGWAWGWVRRYPKNAGYQGSTDIAVWGEVYESMANLLQRNVAKQGVLNSYAGVIVDEYQDCTKPMHYLITQLKRILPCRVLGDDLQGIFTIGEEALVDWADVRAEFETELGTLETPHRWIKAGNKKLGDWLLRARPVFRNNNEPDYRDSTIDRREITFQRLPSTLLSLLESGLPPNSWTPV
jgi:DNA helicase-2/ATP-dependent DNA helicase PcrA